jgi:hypothetical protein
MNAIWLRPPPPGWSTTRWRLVSPTDGLRSIADREHHQQQHPQHRPTPATRLHRNRGRSPPRNPAWLTVLGQQQRVHRPTERWVPIFAYRYGHECRAVAGWPKSLDCEVGEDSDVYRIAPALPDSPFVPQQLDAVNGPTRPLSLCEAHGLRPSVTTRERLEKQNHDRAARNPTNERCCDARHPVTLRAHPRGHGRKTAPGTSAWERHEHGKVWPGTSAPCPGSGRSLTPPERLGRGHSARR